MKRAALEVDADVIAPPILKRARTVIDDVDSAYVSLNSPNGTGSPVAQQHCQIDGSIASTVGSRRPKIFQCTYDSCNKAFDRPARLEIHIRSHTKERPFCCEQDGCGKTFLRSEHLKAHIKSKHADDRNYICTYEIGIDDLGQPRVCGKSFHTGTRLRRHIAAHEDKEQTKCQECGQIFRKQETLQRHIRSIHLNENAYRCDHLNEAQEECGQTFQTVGQLKAHETRDHAGPRYFCDQCITVDEQEGNEQTGFITYAELQAHLKEVHPPTCGMCGYVAASNRGLKAHMEIVHQSLSDRQRFECTYEGCDRKFTKQGNLKVHIQTVHAQIKAYTCGQYDLNCSKNVAGWSGIGCGQAFATKASLEHHIRVHHLGLPDGRAKSRPESMPAADVMSGVTGFAYDEQRPVPCLQHGCESRFRKDHDLVIHLELHHGWNIDDINDALAEVAALQRDKFWIGGYEELEAFLHTESVNGQSSMEAYSSAKHASDVLLSVNAMDLDPVLAGQ